MLSCLPTCDVRDLIFSQFSIDCCQKCVCFRGSAPGPAGGGLQRPQTLSWTKLGHTPISCPDRRTCFHIHLPLATPLTCIVINAANALILKYEMFSTEDTDFYFMSQVTSSIITIRIVQILHSDNGQVKIVMGSAGSCVTFNKI